jgi:hypothetical protein
MPELLAKAVVGSREPTLVYLAAHRHWPFSAESTDEIVPHKGIVIAQTNSPFLATWIAETINARLDGREYACSRPPGIVKRCGHFETSNDNLFAWSWSWGWSRAGLHIARRSSEQAFGQFQDLFAELVAS